MPLAKVTVPPEDRETVLRDLLTLYSVKAESIHEAANDYLSGTGSLTALLDHRAELAAVDSLIEQVHWELDRPPRTSELEGDKPLLRSTLVGALGATVEALSEIQGAPASSLDVPAVREQLKRAERLLEAIDVLR